MATYKLYCMMYIQYIIYPQNRHISEIFGHYYNIIFSQLQTTPQKVTYCLSIFKIMLGIFPYQMADKVKSGRYLVESSRSKLTNSQSSRCSGQFYEDFRSLSGVKVADDTQSSRRSK